jgi:hypothetical protein
MGNYLTIWATIRFWRNTPLQEDSQSGSKQPDIKNSIAKFFTPLFLYFLWYKHVTSADYLQKRKMNS